jgi:rare lipoprotein A (peptidoglycan hydrolase)
MAMRQTIGISLAFLMISSGVIAKPPEKDSPHHPGQWHGKAAKAETRPGKFRLASCKAVCNRAHAHSAGRARNHDADSQSDGYAGGPADAYVGPVHAIGRSEFGTAACYNWVDSRTSSGEILDSVTATAAHGSLPLASYAKVTNLDNGHSVIVKINDRGPVDSSVHHRSFPASRR